MLSQIFGYIKSAIAFIIANLPTAAVLAFFAPVGEFFSPIGFLIILDVLTGVIAAKYFKETDIKSRQWFHKIFYSGFFAIGLIAFLHAETSFSQLSKVSLFGFSLPLYFMSKLYCALYIIYELISILENLDRCGFTFVRPFIQILKSRQNKILKKLEEDAEGEKKDDSNITGA